MIRLFILIPLMFLLACGPKEDSLEGRLIIYSKKVKDQPNDPEAHYQLGKAYIEKEEFQTALHELNEATRLKGDYGEAYREKGIALFYLKHYPDSEKALLKSFKLNPTQPDIATDLGSIYLKNGNMKNALRYLKVAQTRNNNMHIVFNNLGVASEKAGKDKQALKFWKQALEKNPGLPETHVNMGVVYEKMGQKKKAIAVYQKALELDKTNAMAHYNLGVIYAKEKDYPKAIDEWETALKFDRKDESILNSLAWGYEKLGKRKKALAKLKQSIKLSPYDSKTHFSSGRIKYDLEDFDEAIESFKKAVQLDPSFGEAYYRLGLTYDIQNQSYDAISNLLVTELVFHKAKKMDLFKKTRSVLESLFAKYQASREDFKDLQVPETLKGYDLHKRNQIRTSKEK
ncbi:MAG: tetratricopeptide repeat protein [Nitrospina sp.]|jgi:tetratricopeptide (TPR) repeat protein|nr:tetratricopeptide repeat protein [Nitrospina sp.]MBT3511212.1 tetratricopeptide repeat protein [Nitrospina sp.]MBT3876408.1 tetratricopeptide repeat protein [Nitrospina sp.]MBT4047564.1 tetratricopeptide repeat protein [Nitrospina sp.]MBT4558079.1 tetratricopeptide repeat protein [Nitrospina sp.]